jgi:hypothetical protein
LISRLLILGFPTEKVEKKTTHVCRYVKPIDAKADKHHIIQQADNKRLDHTTGLATFNSTKYVHVRGKSIFD